MDIHFPPTETKEKILFAAIELFSERGYSKVSMRDIAAAVGITAASIYNHYPSKETLLGSIYAFYNDQQLRLFDSNEDFIRQAESIVSLSEILPAMSIRYAPPALDRLMNRVVSIAMREINTHPDSEAFVRRVIFDNVNERLRPLFLRMVELGKLQPFDVETFLCLFNYLAFASVMLYGSPLRIGDDRWSAAVAMLFGGLIKPAQ